MTYVPPTLEQSGSVGIDGLRDRHVGETCYIVGKGPSLKHLRYTAIGPGPVITLNEAIIWVQHLGLPNRIYSMQKDGCATTDPLTVARPCGQCDGWNPPTDLCPAKPFDPYAGISVLFSQHLSSWCFRGRPNRFVFTDEQLGYPDPRTMSVFDAISLAGWFGCGAIIMCCFDSITTGDLRTVVAGKQPVHEADEHYEWAKPVVLQALEDFPHAFVTPTPKEGP